MIRIPIMKLKRQDLEEVILTLMEAYLRGKEDAYEEIIDGLAEGGLEIWEVGEDNDKHDDEDK